VKFPDEYRCIIKGNPAFNSKSGDDFGLFIVNRGPKPETTEPTS